MSKNNILNEGNTPLVSIVIPSFNHEDHVQECIESVINQDYKNIELIIIDDGSKDHSVKKIKELIPACEKRFVRFCFHARSNKGLSATLNEAIQWCAGVYFSAIASDDKLLPNKTSLLLQYIDKEDGLPGIFCGCYFINNNGERIEEIRVNKRYLSFEDIILRKHNVFTPTQLLDLDCIKEVGGYKNNLYIEDFYMWLALTEKGNKLRVVDELLVEYRLHDNNIRDPLKMHEGRKNILEYFSENKLYKKAMAINCLVASDYFTVISKIKSIKLIFESISHHKIIIFSLFFSKSLIKIVIPNYFFLQVTRLKYVALHNIKQKKR